LQKDQSFLDIIEEYVSSDQITLPPFDRTAIRIQQEIQKPDASVSKIEKLIIADPAMSSQILKLANSAFYRGLSKASTIREAVVRLGLEEVTRMALILTQKKLYNTGDSYIKNFRSSLWQHTLVCALSSQWVAKEAGFEEIIQEVFFASLMHDIGKLFLITVIEQVQASGKISVMPSKNVISEIIKSQHSAQGYSLLKKWNLPDKYCMVAKEHHQEKLNTSNTPLIILRLVNKIYRKARLDTQEKEDPSISITTEASFFGFSDIKIAELELHIEDSLKRVSSHYKISA
jgi:HD-like signal output (HDOD) protein